MELPNKEFKPTVGKPEIKPEIEEIIKPEIKPEFLEKKETPQPEKKGEAPVTKPPVSGLPFLKKKSEIVLEKSETLKEIENILSEGLEEVYQNLPEAVKEQFKKKGEETASKIEKIISQAKIAVNKILNLIKNWLKMIPGVNKFFLEQEAKIKTDKILALAERKRKQKLQI
jgi:hypothetical protein